MKLSTTFQTGLAVVMLLVNGACATRPLLYSLGEPEVKVQSTAWIELTGDEKESLKNKSCITHLYRCDFDDKGQVTALTALDLSHPEFKELSEESLQAWKFKPGKSGQCFVDFIYTDDAQTRIVVLPQEIAEKVVSTRVQERSPRPTARKKTKSIHAVKPQYPRDALVRGEIGVVKFLLDVNPDGVPENLRVIHSYPERKFDGAARAALLSWRYKPLAEDPDTDRSNINVTFFFNIDGSLGYDCPLGY